MSGITSENYDITYNMSYIVSSITSDNYDITSDIMRDVM